MKLYQTLKYLTEKIQNLETKNCLKLPAILLENWLSNYRESERKYGVCQLCLNTRAILQSIHFVKFFDSFIGPEQGKKVSQMTPSSAMVF